MTKLSEILNFDSTNDNTMLFQLQVPIPELEGLWKNDKDFHVLVVCINISKNISLLCRQQRGPVQKKNLLLCYPIVLY